MIRIKDQGASLSNQLLCQNIFIWNISNGDSPPVMLLKQTLPEAQQTRPGYWVQNLNYLWKLKRIQIPLLAFFHSLVTTFPPCAAPCHPTRPPPLQWQPLPLQCQWSNNLYCRQHDHSTPAPTFLQLLYHHLAHNGLDHHLNDDHQLKIALVASSVGNHHQPESHQQSFTMPCM